MTFIVVLLHRLSCEADTSMRRDTALSVTMSALYSGMTEVLSRDITNTPNKQGGGKTEKKTLSMSLISY